MVTNLLPSREEASTVFGDPRSLTIPDPVHLKLAPFPTRSLLPSQFYLLCRFPKRSIVSRSLPLGSTATLAALPAMSLIPVAPFGLSVCPSMSLPNHVEAEVTKMGLKLVYCPRSLAPTLVALPSMSLIPSAPFRSLQAARLPLQGGGSHAS